MGAEAASLEITRRGYHFGAGPAMLPPEVIAEIRDELPDFCDTGISILELGHRTPEFRALTRGIESDLRELMGIPPHYAVLFLPGGATLQFAMAPLNLGRHGGYLVTGLWSAKALQEAERLTQGQVVWDGRDSGYTRIPACGEWQSQPDAPYLHYTPNETIAGVEFHATPESSLPLVADMTSMILSRPVEVSKHALIYASAQKNLGIAGITVIILDPAALRAPDSAIPAVLNYRTCMQAESLPNTPPVFAWYVLGKMLTWIRSQGGPQALAMRNHRKAEMLYAILDHSGFYLNHVEKTCRSWMNVPFRLRDQTLEPVFLREAEEQAGLKNLAGHRSTGGVRASLYNAMPEAGVAALTAFMHEFERRHG